ncbi:MAG: aldo/keto reductase [Succinivibrio sp.]|nr:aldo/keto reductase [Succinivibrio sp.]
MPHRKLGTIEVSPIGMGCMGLSHGYGQIPEENYSIEAIRQAYDFGCTFFDTAEVYSPNLEGLGHNELIVGKALQEVRHKVVLATKLHIGTAEPAQDGSLYASVKRHLLASMQRLKTDYVDLYYLHRINPAIPVEEVAEAMGRLLGEGLIRGWGLSQVTTDTIDRAHKVTALSAVQNIYSLVERGVEEDVIPYCLQHHIGLVPFSPIASGLLSGKLTVETKFEDYDDVRKFVPQLKAENLQANLPIVEVLGEFALRKGATCAQISLAWMLKKYPNVVPIPGSKNKERILENLGAWNVELSDEEFARLEEALGRCKIHGQRGYDEAEGRSFLQHKS